MTLSFSFAAGTKLASFDPKVRRVYLVSGVDLPRDLKSSLPEAIFNRLSEAAAQAHHAQAAKSGAFETEIPAPCLTVPLTEGGFVKVAWIPADFDSFETQEALRKHLAGSFKKSGALEIDLSRLNADRQPQVLEWLASLSTLAAYTPAVFGRRASGAKPGKPESVAVKVVSRVTPGAFRQAVELGQKLGEANNRVRGLADLPGSELNPTTYKKKLEAYARDEKVTLKYMGMSELKKMGAGSFLAVVKADPNTDSGIAHLSYKPAGAKKKIVFVGKGLCFDTGGYNVKVGNYMNGMHRDMTGSAVAWNLFRVVKELGLKVEVHAVLAIAENLISPTAYRADDVVTAMDGTSIEVVNTDAEGRMVLADTLAYAAKLEADLIFDFATLTGSAVRAIDTRRSVVFANRDSLARLAVECGEECGERTWSLPLSRDYKRGLKSDVADILQCCHGSNSDAIYAATFLRHFVGEGSPWLHLDLSSHSNKGGLGLVGTETTGFGVRWALATARRYLKI